MRSPRRDRLQMNLSEKENIVEDYFQSLVEGGDPSPDEEAFVELYYFLGQTLVNGVHNFLDYEHLDKTLASLDRFGFEDIGLKLRALSAATDVERNAETPVMFDEFEKELDARAPDIIGSLFEAVQAKR